MFSQAVALLPKHRIKGTECGEARIGDDFRTLWGSVSCEQCPAKRPGEMRIVSAALSVEDREVLYERRAA